MRLFPFRRVRSIYDVAEAQRAALLRDEQRVVNRLRRSYMVAESAIDLELAKVLRKISAAMEDGTPITPFWLYQEARLEALLAEVKLEIARFGSDAEAITRAQQARNVAMASRFAGELVGAAGVKTGFVMLHKEAFTDLVGFMSNGSPLNHIFREFGTDTVDEVRRVFAKGMALGKNPRVVGKWIEEAVGDAVEMNRNRAVLIARTETMRAFRVSTLRNYQQNPTIVQGWRWLSGRDWRCCPVCIAMDGSTHPLSEPFASHPGCRCSAVPVLREDLDTNIGTGEEWLEEQDEATQLSVMRGSKERLRLWQDGEVSLDDMVEETTSPKWGPGKRLKALRDLRP